MESKLGADAGWTMLCRCELSRGPMPKLRRGR